MLRSSTYATLGWFALTLGCASARHKTSSTALQTRAERTNYQATSSYADVQSFIDALRTRYPSTFTLGEIGQTNDGRTIPYVLASRPLVRTVEEARALGRPIVYLNANIHAGEVEGKEAVLALLRDLAGSERPNALDSVVVIAVPIYNADGNERWAAQEINRPDQLGPERVGTRANARGLDLNRDYVKAEAPETRGALTMFVKWDPDVYVDLHTTDGSYHGFALTYSPSLNPVADRPGFAGTFTRDTLLPEIRKAMQGRGFSTFDYGNFDRDEDDASALTDSVKHAWSTYDPRPRFGTNYFGMRGRVSILSEAYSHDPFERRIASTRAFVSEILSSAARHSASLRAIRESEPVLAPVPLQARLTANPDTVEMAVEVLVATGDSARTQPGVPRGVRRTGRFNTQRIAVYDRFEPVHSVMMGEGYVIPAKYTDVIESVRRHGLPMRISEGETVEGMEFVIDSVIRPSSSFQGHRQTRLRGQCRAAKRVVPQGSVIVTTQGRLGPLATYLLEPESDDGFVTWNFLDDAILVGAVFPVFRIQPPR